MITVKATREGLVGHKTSSGYIIDRVVYFVALPSTRALHRFVRIVNPLRPALAPVLAQVLDVGPWNEHDDDYVFNGARPLSEQKVDVSGNGTTNDAGIDLGEAVYAALGMLDNTNVSWEFV